MKPKTVKIAGVSLAVVAITVILLLVLGGKSRKTVHLAPVASLPTLKVPVSQPKPVTFDWPEYGRVSSHTQNLNVGPRPPFRTLWQAHDTSLLEFSPVIAGSYLYQIDNQGYVSARSAKTGDLIWQIRIGSLAAAAPAYSQGRLYVVMLSGQVAALNAQTGKVIWSWQSGSRIESSPVLDNQGNIYFGSQSGTLYSVNQQGQIRWKENTDGALKGSPSLAYGNVYIGSYGGTIYSFKQTTGQPVWQTTPGGQFYATATIINHMVIAGNIDGTVYAFDSGNGRLIWQYNTGSYVYGAAAESGHGNLATVIVGSYNGWLYCLWVANGQIRWQRHLGGAISGATTVIDNVVYVADIRISKTLGYNVLNGKSLFSYPSGGFDAAVSDGQTIYLSNWNTLTALTPKN